MFMYPMLSVFLVSLSCVCPALARWYGQVLGVDLHGSCVVFDQGEERRAFFLQVWRVGQPNACSMESMHEFCLCLFETQHAALLWIFSRAVLSRVVFKGSQTELAIFQQGPDQGFVGCFLGTLVAYLEVPL